MNAPDYLKLWEKHKVWKGLKSAKHQERFKRITLFLRGKTFVDVGCGFGHSTYHMKKMIGGEWIGVDFGKRAVEQARINFPDIDFLYLSDIDRIKTLPTFDSVVCSEVIEHVEDDQLLVDNLIAITEKILIITTPSRKVKSKGHLRLYTVEMLFKLFKNYPDFHCIEYHPFFYVIFEKGLK